MTEPFDLKRFGRIVRARREGLGIQQEDLDQYGGPSSTTLSRIERGLAGPSPKTLRKLDTGLRWTEGSAKRTLAGGEPDELTDLMSERIRLHAALAAAITAGDRDEQARLQHELAKVDAVQAQLERVTADVPPKSERDAPRLRAMVDLSFLADEVDSVIPIMSPDPDDAANEIENYIDEVENLVSAAEELTDAVHKAVLAAFDGDVAKLRQMKREVRRINLAGRGARQTSIFVFDEATTDHALGQGDRSAGEADGDDVPLPSQ